MSFELKTISARDYNYQEPNIVGYFSIDGNRHQHNDFSNFQYIRKDVDHLVSQNLNEGLSKFIVYDQQPDNREKLSKFITWCKDTDYKYLSQIERNKTTFITNRGLLKKLMIANYDERTEWLVVSMKYKNLIFLCEFPTDSKKEFIMEGVTEKQRRNEYYGRRFEQLVLTERGKEVIKEGVISKKVFENNCIFTSFINLIKDEPDGEPDLTKPANANEEFGILYDTELNNKFRILISAEMDGFETKNDEQPVEGEFNMDLLRNNVNSVELKTNSWDCKGYQFTKSTLLNWWAQCFLVGVDKIICGKRDAKGILNGVETFKTSEIPSLAQKFWNPRKCMATLDDVLTFISDTVNEQPDYTTLKFEYYVKYKTIKAKAVTDPEELNNFNILPQEFRNTLEKYF